MDHLSDLIQAVEAADSASRLVKTVENLAEAKLEGAIPTLISILGYNNPGAAVAAVEGLVQLGDIAVPEILEQLDGHNYTARAWAVRALAGIGDPRGLMILLEAATTDFAPSVRRAATRGLGTIKWHWFPENLLGTAQTTVLATLLKVAQQDEEWVVRYAAVLGLETLDRAIAVADSEERSQKRSQIRGQLAHMAEAEDNLAVRARVWLAQENLNTLAQTKSAQRFAHDPSPLSTTEWQVIVEKLGQQRSSSEPHPI